MRFSAGVESGRRAPGFVTLGPFRLRIFVLLLGIGSGTGLAVDGPERRPFSVEKPAAEARTPFLVSPLQTGQARRGVVTAHGLYRLPAGIPAPFDLGRKLPLLAGNTVFLRAVDDLYSGENVVWAGELRIDGPPGSLPSPRAQGFVSGDGGYRAVFRSEVDGQFHANTNKEPAPSWYFPKEFDLIGERVAQDGKRRENRVAVTVDASSPLPGPGEIRIGLNSNAPTGKPNRLAVSVNGTEVAAAEWEGTGYRVVRAPFDGALLRDGTNVVGLLGDPGYSKLLDFVEVETLAFPAPRERGLVVRADADAHGLSFPGAIRVVDVTDAGAERDVPGQELGGALRVDLVKGRLYYVASTVEPLAFSDEVLLEEPAAAGKDLLVVGPALAAEPLRPLLAAKGRAGLSAVFVPFEQLRDVYGGGIYGPGGLEAAVRRLRPKYLLIASGFHRDCRRREPGASRADDFTPGVPAVLRHVEQMTASDDPYSMGQTVGVGRLPARNAGELAAWVSKALEFAPTDRALLLAGRQDQENFPVLQKNLLGIFPASFVSLEGLSREQAVPAVREALKDGARLVVYQGHGQSWELDKGMLTGKDGGALPASSWFLATCNSAYYFADYEVFLRDWLFHPSGGAVHSIAATAIARADVQDAAAKAFLQALTRQPDLTWGRMLNLLKRTVPVDVDVLKTRTDLPAFFLAGVAEEQRSVEVLTLLGDPTAPILPASRRRASVAFPSVGDRTKIAPPGELRGTLTLDGPWTPGSSARLALAWVAGRPEPWHEAALEPPRPGIPARFGIPAGTGDEDGGPVRMRLLERGSSGPETVWLETTISRESSSPRAPNVVARRVYSYEKGAFVWTCLARNPGTFAEQRQLRSQFQFGDAPRAAGVEPAVCADSGWLTGLRQELDDEFVNGARLVRARVSREGATGEWSDWIPLAVAAPGGPPETAR